MGKTFPRSPIMNAVYEDGCYISDCTIDSHVKNLRHSITEIVLVCIELFVRADRLFTRCAGRSDDATGATIDAMRHDLQSLLFFGRGCDIDNYIGCPGDTLITNVISPVNVSGLANRNGYSSRAALALAIQRFLMDQA